MDVSIGGGSAKKLKPTKFTARGILAIYLPGWYADPETRGLYLRVFEGADGPSHSWLYRFTSPVSGKRRAMGLGSLDICSLANARQQSLDLRRSIFEGIDPIEQRQAKKLGVKESHQNSITFKEAADTSTVINGVNTTSTKHSNFKRVIDWPHESGFRYIFHANGDINRELILTVLVFHIPG